MKILKSVGAVVAGILLGAALSLGTDELFHMAHIYPPWGETTSGGPLLLATVYRIIYGVVGGYVTARLAPDRPMGHALALGVVGLMLCVVGAIVTWNHVPSLGPHWFPIALVVTALPCSWVGGKFRVMQLQPTGRGSLSAG